ncbi:integrin alpha [Catalinimonas alkaloidigena]|nr:integrin alpha [Catalinimonas alkaloidigena]
MHATSAWFAQFMPVSNKPRKAYLLALLAISISAAQAQQSAANTPNQSDWYQQAQQQLDLRQYRMQAAKSPHTYASANPQHSLGFVYTPEGYTVQKYGVAGTDRPAWQLHFGLQRIGRAGQGALPATYQRSEAQTTALTYQFAHYRVEYTNSTQGMRQNFVVSQAPEGTGALEVTLSLSGDLTAQQRHARQVAFHTPGAAQDVQLVYDEIKVWDATQRLLPATMELRNEQELVLVVDDREAVYPVTVDPLNHAPDWTDAGDGLLFSTLSDLTTPTLYGYSVSGAGDVNGDGYDDVLVGAPTYVEIINVSAETFNFVSVGAAFLYLGSATGPSITPDEVLQPTTEAGALMGFSVSGAGDVNGDGYDDVLVGAPGDRTNLTIGLGTVSVAVGKVYVYSGADFDGDLMTSPTVSATVFPKQADFGVLVSTPANPLYGFSVSEAGDVNGDGYADVIVGAPAYTDLVLLNVSGRADIYHGSSTGLGSAPARKIKGGLASGLFGYSVDGGAKINNDTYDDVIVGAPASMGAGLTGAAYVFHGSATGITATSTAGAATSLRPVGLELNTLFGFSVSTLNDVNSDGRDDVAVGEPLSLELFGADLVAVGNVHLYYGANAGLLTTGATTLTSPRSPLVLEAVEGNLLYGFSVSDAGDVNCDGITDVIIGEPGGLAVSTGTGILGLVDASQSSGHAYVYFGKSGSGPINQFLWQLKETPDPSVANLMGACVSGVGDINGDGGSDFMISAPTGTLNLSTSLTGLIGNAVGYLTTGGVGRAHGYHGCKSFLSPPSDNDWDDDGMSNLEESNGNDPAGDDDNDGIYNYLDSTYIDFIDENGDGINDAFDYDYDGLPNHLDVDSDNDGMADAVEANGGVTPANLLPNGFFPLSLVKANDSDNDGWIDLYDTDNGGTSYENPDTDSDGQKDFLDLDSDSDDLLDYVEALDDNYDDDIKPELLARAADWEAANGSPGYYDSSLDDDADGIPNWMEDDDENGTPNFLQANTTYAPTSGRVVSKPTQGQQVKKGTGFPAATTLASPLAGGSYFFDSDQDGIIDLLDPDQSGMAATIPDEDGNGMADYRQIAPLPITLVSFAAVPTTKTVELTWETAAEFNNSHFEIERSQNGQNFETIGQLRGAGTSHQRLAYQFTDQRPYTGENYYRLKQVDLDGTVSYTETQSVFRQGYFDWVASPNPFDADLTLYYQGTVEGTAEIRVVTPQGRLIAERTLPLMQHTRHVLPAQWFPQPGVYYLTLRCGTQHQVVKVLKTE